MFLEFEQGRVIQQVNTFSLPDDVLGYNKLMEDPKKEIVSVKEKVMPGTPGNEHNPSLPSTLLVMVFYKIKEGDMQ